MDDPAAQKAFGVSFVVVPLEPFLVK